MTRYVSVLGMIGSLAFAAPVTGVTLILSQPIVLNPFCPAPCPVDGVKKGRFQMKSVDTPGSNGLLFRVKLSGATSGGSPASFGNVSIILPLDATGPSSCGSFTATPFMVSGGKLDAVFTAAQLSPAFSPGSGAIVTLCGFVSVRDDSTSFAIGGVPSGS